MFKRIGDDASHLLMCLIRYDNKKYRGKILMRLNNMSGFESKIVQHILHTTPNPNIYMIILATLCILEIRDT